jgi:hypothetical protein
MAELISIVTRTGRRATIVIFSRGNDINVLVSGDIQFDQTSPDKVIHSALGGFPVKMVMATTSGLNLALVVQLNPTPGKKLKSRVAHRFFFRRVIESSRNFRQIACVNESIKLSVNSHPGPVSPSVRQNSSYLNDLPCSFTSAIL